MRIFSLCLMLLVVSCNNSTVGTRSSIKGGGPVTITDTNGSEILSYSGSYALIIGQSDYAHWGDLSSIPSELDEVESVLKDQSFVVERHKNLNSKDLKRAFERFINNYGLDKNNRLLFFYSGHGESRKVDGNTKGYIVPVDAPTLADNKGFIRKAVEMEQIVTWSKKIEAKHALFLFDSCFSGTIFRGEDTPIPKKISKAMAQPIRYFITAGSANEKVPASSTFTPAFVDALRYAKADKYKDGYVTGEELGLYLKNTVQDFTTQTPQYGRIGHYKSNRGDFVFKVKNKSKPPVINVAELDSIKREKAELARIRRQKEAALADLANAKREKAELAGIKRQKEAEKAELARIKREQARLARIKRQRPKSKVFQDRLRDGGLAPKMVRIPAGSFRMGDIQGGGDSDEKPVHRVSVGKFAMGMYEVTVGEYMKFVNATNSHTPEWLEKGSSYNIKTGSDNHYKKHGSALTNRNHPIVGVSWHDAVAYTKWLSNQTDNIYYLPTEAEWEYAARAGTETKYWWGNDIGKNRANCDGCGSQWDNKQTAPVGSFSANKFGLYDTSGNVWEWTCSEKTDKYNGKEKNCINKNSNKNRVLRGGSWYSYPRYVRTAYRPGGTPDDRGGFRVVVMAAAWTK